MELDNVAKRRRFIINITFYALILGLLYLFLEYALKWVMPFLLGFLVALAFRPVISFCVRKLKLNKRFCAFVVVLIGYFLVGLLLWWAGSALFQTIKDFCMNLPAIYAKEIAPFFGAANEGLLNFAEWFSPEMATQVEEVLANALTGLQESLVEISTGVLTSLAGASTKIPLWMISFIFTILSSLFISMDYDHVMDFIRRQIPEKKRMFLLDVKNYLGKTVVSYLKAYLILMCITFTELSVGFLALRIENPFRIAAITALCDVLPILGTGTVVIPWAIISLLQHRYYLALGLILLYLIVTAVRQFIEPKVIGDQLGIPPIVAIICIYLGFVWFGVWGAILIPVLMNIVFSLQKAGKIHVWK